MPGYRTIPTKDTFDVEERLGGIVTVKQLAFFIVAVVATYATYILGGSVLSSSDAFSLAALVFVGSVVFIAANLDKWLLLRLNYYVFSDQKALERDPALLRNIRSIEEDKIVTLDGRVMAILQVTPINFPLLSDEAKEARIAAYEMYLRQLVYPIMHVVQSDNVEPEEYFANLLVSAEAAARRRTAGIGDYAAAHVRFVREFLKNNRVRAKNHYVVLQVQDPRYRGNSAPRLRPGPLRALALRVKALGAEFQPQNIYSGGPLFEKPPNYVLIDLAGRRMVFGDERRMPAQAPARASKAGPLLQFESEMALLRFARSQSGVLYYGELDVEMLLQKEFMDLSLRAREKEFSVDERRRHVGLSAGKTRWAYDEVEKHIAVLTDKLEATGLRVSRVRGEEIYTGKHSSLMRASRVSVTPHHLRVDDTYMKVVYATGYPYQVSLGWLANIVDGREDYDLTMYVYPISIPEALSTFRGAILKLTTEKKARSDFLDPETEQHLEDVKNFFTQIVSGKEKYFLASVYITCKAPSPKSLDTVLEKCKSDLAGASIDYEVADYEMAKAVYATRLTGSDLPAKRREFPSSSLAATFPHISSSMAIDPEGLFFAFDWMNAPIIFDLRKLPNQHIAITGESGSGKSYFAKSLIPRYLIGGYRVFVTDPDGEYVELAEHFGGAVSTVGPRGAVINPFDLGGRDVNDKIRSLLGLMAIITGSLTKYQEGLIGEALGELFEKAGRGGKSPTFGDFSRLLSKQMAASRDEQMRHDLQFLIISIRPFLKGNIYGFIDAQTSVGLDARMHVFDLRAYQNDKTLRDFFNYLIFDFITHQLLSDRTLKALFMDEGWTMVNYPSSEDYVRYIIKDSRKYNVSFVFLTQELEDMLQSQAGRSILNNTATQFIFHQKESAMALMRTTLNLTHEESEKLLSCGKGEGLMISDKFRLLFRVHTSPTEHALISPELNEKAAGKKKAKAGRRTAGKLQTLAVSEAGQPVWKQIEKDSPPASHALGELGPGAAAPDEKEVAGLRAATAADALEKETGAPQTPAPKPAGPQPNLMPARLPIALSHGLLNRKEAALVHAVALRNHQKRLAEAVRAGLEMPPSGAKAPAQGKKTGKPAASKARRRAAPRTDPGRKRAVKAAKPAPTRKSRLAARAKSKSARKPAAHKAPAAGKKEAPKQAGGFSITFVEKKK